MASIRNNSDSRKIAAVAIVRYIDMYLNGFMAEMRFILLLLMFAKIIKICDTNGLFCFELEPIFSNFAN